MKFLKPLVFFLERISPGGVSNTESNDCNQLPSVIRRGNWKIKRQKLPHFLVKDAGIDLDSIVSEMVEACRKKENCSVAFAGEKTNVPNKNRPIRIIHSFNKGHVGHTDIDFRYDSNDLYVKFDSKPWTLISYLRMLCFFICFVVLFLFIFNIYIFVSGTKKSMFMDYAQKYSSLEYGENNGSTFLYNQLLDGYHSINWISFYKILEENPSFASKSEELEEITFKALAYASTEQIKNLFGDFANEKPTSTTSNNDLEAMTSSIEKVKAIEEMENITFFISKGIEYNLISGGEMSMTWFGEFGEGAMDSVSPMRVAGVPIFLSWFIHQYLYNEFGSNDVFTYILRNASPIGGVERPYSCTHYSTNPEIEIRAFVEACFKDWDPKFCQTILDALQKSTTYTKPASIWSIIIKDPKIAVWNLTWPFAIIGAITGGLLFFIPQSLLRHPCRWLGWPAPDEFNNMIIQRDTIIEKELSEILARNGIYENQIIKIE